MQADLLDQLAAGATLVTPNRRLAQHFKLQFDAAQVSAGRTAWPSADILPWPAFVARCFDAIAASLDTAPLLLTTEQESVLWDQAVERAAVDAGLLSPAQTAAQCSNAWTLAHAWHFWPRMKSLPLSEDARAFVAWAESYEAQCKRAGAIDSARLPGWVSAHLDDVVWARPQTLLLAGFDLRTPAQRTLLEALTNAGTNVLDVSLQRPDASARRVACVDADAELVAASRWTRSRLEANPAARIGIVVPDLAERREAVMRIFAEVLLPANAELAAVDVSLGTPLADWPLVHDALLLLDATRRHALPFAHWSALLRSPFLGGAMDEAAARARLDASLRETCFAEETFEGMRRAIPPTLIACPQLVAALNAFAAASKDATALRIPPGEWGQHFTQWLQAAGFPGERPLDSIEHQTLAKLRGLFEGLSALDRVLPRITLADALSRVKRLAVETLFQPEVQALSVQVLGILESAGLDFDHLWVCGLTADTWPLTARPNPFIPLVLQREAGVPEASADAALAVDRRITAGWKTAASEVVFSHALHDGDRELLPSPLIASVNEVALQDVAPDSAGTWAEAMFAARTLDAVQDETAPPLQVTGPLSWGAAAIRDQAACPFRAQARHRLRARALEEPAPGLDAMQRGTLLHVVLQKVWTELKDQDGLFDRDEAMLATDIEAAVADVLRNHRAASPLKVQPRLAALEAARLKRLVLLWLEVEKQRAPFSVEAMEEKCVVQAGALPLSVRLDRRDRLLLGDLAGRALVIDYKTGRSSVSGWDGERPDEPQLPLYLLADADDIAALAFAQVRLDDMGYKGLAAADGIAKGIRVPKSEGDESAADAWQQRVDQWRTVISALGDAFVAGHAAVDPKQFPKTCSQCDLHLLCRVADRAVEPESAEGADE